MTQPTLPTAGQQQEAALAVFAQYEPPLYEAYLEMMLEWLAAVKVAMFAGGVARLGLVPDPLKVFSQTPKWTALTAQYTADVAREVLAAPYKDLFADGTVFATRPFVRNWIADRENRLSAVPTEVYGLVAQIVDSATTNGASIPDVTDQIEQLFGDTDVQKWKNRARTVARTEVVGAYNGGLHDAFTMLAEADPGTQYVKRWLATEDARTRPDHVEADGQTVPFDQPFTVGGFQMMHPHDPTAPAKEVVNCVIGSTQVRWAGQNLHGTTRRLHTGPFVQLRTAEGHDLTVTPNHPVLTPDGYVPAGLLRPGQYVMGTLDAEAPKVNDGPSSAEEIHGALREVGTPQGVRGSRMDFHGDGSDAEVEIVSADGYLPIWPNSSGRRHAQEQILVGPNDRERPLSGVSDSVVLWLPLGGDVYSGGDLAPSLVSRGGQGATLRAGQPGHPEPVRLMGTADIEAEIRKTPDQGLTAEPDFPAHLQYALALGMSPTKIIEVNRFAGSHFVYNLSTSDRWYSGNGIALHNCRCVELMEIKNEPTKMGNRQYKGAPALVSSGLTLMQEACTDGQFCMLTHKPGLCKGQKRGQTEPGQTDATKQTPAQVAQTAVTGLSQAISQAQAMLSSPEAQRNPKLAAQARSAISGYRKALAPHQQTLKNASRTNDQAKRTSVQDAKQQDTLDKRKARQKESLDKAAQRILSKRAEKAKLAKMTPHQRSEYHKAKAKANRKTREAQENKTLKQAGKG